MFRRRKSLHIGTDFGNNSDCSENAADARSGLENGKFLLIGTGERKNEFFKLCLPGFKVFIVSFDYFQFIGLFWCDKAVNGITEFREFLFQGKPIFCWRKRRMLMTGMTNWNGTTSMECDALGRLTAVTDHNGRRNGFSHDAAGRMGLGKNPEAGYVKVIVKIITECREENKCNEIVDFLNELLGDILLELGKGIRKDKQKIIKMIFSAHNLPRVYLSKNISTLCLMGRYGIGPEEALKYAKLSMDEGMMIKYNSFMKVL